MPEPDGAVFGSPACGNDTAADPRAGAGGVPPRPPWWSSGWPCQPLCRSVRRPLCHQPRSAVGECRGRGRARPGVGLSTPRRRCAPIWLSDHHGAAVEALCAEASQQLKVRGYFGRGEDVWTGWTSAKSVL